MHEYFRYGYTVDKMGTIFPCCCSNVEEDIEAYAFETASPFRTAVPDPPWLANYNYSTRLEPVLVNVTTGEVTTRENTTFSCIESDSLQGTVRRDDRSVEYR